MVDPFPINGSIDLFIVTFNLRSKYAIRGSEVSWSSSLAMEGFKSSVQVLVVVGRSQVQIYVHHGGQSPSKNEFVFLDESIVFGILIHSFWKEWNGNQILPSLLKKIP